MNSKPSNWDAAVADYRRATQPLRNAFNEATAPAWRQFLQDSGAYRDVRFAALHEACAPHLKVLHEACEPFERSFERAVQS